MAVTGDAGVKKVMVRRPPSPRRARMTESSVLVEVMPTVGAGAKEVASAGFA